jgi:hypothetical protein
MDVIKPKIPFSAVKKRKKLCGCGLPTIPAPVSKYFIVPEDA